MGNFSCYAPRPDLDNPVPLVEDKVLVKVQPIPPKPSIPQPPLSFSKFSQEVVLAEEEKKF